MPSSSNFIPLFITLVSMCVCNYNALLISAL